MIGETALVGAISAFLTQRKIDRWARLILSCLISGACTLLGIFGSSGIAHLIAGQSIGLSLAFALCEACVATSGILYFTWRKSPLTKGMPISVPVIVEQAEREQLKQGIVTCDPKGE